MIIQGLGNGTVDAHAETRTFAETSLLTDFLAHLISLEDLHSVASPSLNLILRFLLSLAELLHRDKDALAPILLTQSPKELSLFVDASELTTEFVEISNSLLIPASAPLMLPIAHAAFPETLLTLRSPARLALLREMAQFRSTATVAP